MISQTFGSGVDTQGPAKRENDRRKMAASG